MVIIINISIKLYVKIKKTKYKRKQARVEYNLGLSILRETDLFKRAVLILKMLNQIDKSAELDPRL